MSLHNLKEQGMIILSEYLRSESDITRYESENDDYFSEEIVTIGGDRDYRRIEEEEEAYLNADSVSNFLRNFERNLTDDSRITGFTSVNRRNSDSSDLCDEDEPPNKRRACYSSESDQDS